MIKPIKLTEITNKISTTLASSASLGVNSSIKKIDEASLNCLESIGRAQVSFARNILTPQSEEEVMSLVAKILKQKDMVLHQYASEKYIRGGRKIDDFEDLIYDDIRGKCVRNNDGFLNKILFVNKNDNTVEVYDSNGVMFKQYDSLDMEAMHQYKYFPEMIHSRLRHGKYTQDTEDDLFNAYTYTLDRLFNNPEKNYVLDEPKIVYRALQNKLNDEQIFALENPGSVFPESSYASTSLELFIAQNFQQNNPILEITLPKGTKYLDLDELFNIDRTHWHEQEYLLPRNSKFLITGYDETKDVIKAEYILPE